MDTYQERLADAMGEKFTEKDLMRVTGVSYQAVKKVMQGKSTCFDTIHNVEAAKLLGVASDWLAIGEGPRERAPQPSGQDALRSGKDLQMIFDMIPVDAPTREPAYNACFDILMDAKRQAANQPTPGTVQARSSEISRA